MIIIISCASKSTWFPAGCGFLLLSRASRYTHTGTLGPPSASVCVCTVLSRPTLIKYTHTLPPPSCKSTLLRDVFIPCFIIFILFFPGIFVTEREPGGPWLGIYLSRHNLSVPYFIFSPCLWGAFFYVWVCWIGNFYILPPPTWLFIIFWCFSLFFNGKKFPSRSLGGDLTAISCVYVWRERIKGITFNLTTK